jgi:hypothetical protein
MLMIVAWWDDAVNLRGMALDANSRAYTFRVHQISTLLAEHGVYPELFVDAEMNYSGTSLPTSINSVDLPTRDQVYADETDTLTEEAEHLVEVQRRNASELAWRKAQKSVARID